MRTTALLPSLLMTLAMPIIAQTAPSTLPPPPAGSNWQRVQSLALGSSIYVSTAKKTTSCKLQLVDADSLTCAHGKLVYPRTEIKAVKLTRRTLSTLLATGVGAGTGAIIGFAVGTNGSDSSFFGKNFLRGAVTAVGAAAGGVIGAPIGFFTDLNRSTVYRTP